MGSFHFYIAFLVFLLSVHAVSASELQREILSDILAANVKRHDDHDDEHDDDHDDEHDDDHEHDHEHGEVGDIGHLFDESRVHAHTESEKAAILAKHRKLRGKTVPEASDMEYMTWNDELAHLANLWASVCFPGHGLPEHEDVDHFSDGIGQNIELGAIKPNGIEATKAWYKERQDFNYHTNKCNKGRICGHYTQIVWAKTTEVGCGRAFCEQTINSDGTPGNRKNKWIEVCHYAPAGNIGNQKPFQDGQRCTKCASGIGQCDENACRLCSDHPGDECDCRQMCHKCGTKTSDCTCACEEGWSGPDCSTECKDTHARCWREWFGPGFCGSQNVLKGCPLMCQQCIAPTECVA